MIKLGNAKSVQTWLDQMEVIKVVVVSPHLDDAVFSVAGLLGALKGQAEVITVFTEGSPGSSDDWARLSGFTDSVAEHEARRQEDALAMGRLGCPFWHVGLRAGEAACATASDAVKAIAQSHPSGLAQTLVLLPAGAGGPAPASRLRLLAQRLLRRPWGCMPHEEHELTRDLFWQALTATPARLGFYAELPYAWSHTNQALQERLGQSLGCQTELVEYRHDIARKVALVELYQSQLLPIFGPNPAYRRRVLERAECVYVVQRPDGSGPSSRRDIGTGQPSQSLPTPTLHPRPRRQPRVLRQDAPLDRRFARGA